MQKYSPKKPLGLKPRQRKEEKTHSTPLSASRTTYQELGKNPQVQPVKQESKYTKDKFLKLLEKLNKDNSDFKAIYRKLKDNVFFTTYASVFEDLSPEAPIYICKYLKLERYKQNEIVYKMGDDLIGKLYLVYKGELASLKTSDNQKGKGHATRRKSVHQLENKTDQSSVKSIFALRHANSTIGDDKTTPLTTTNSIVKAYMTPISSRKSSFEGENLYDKIYQEGDYFGQESLMNQPQRMNTIIAITDSIVLSLVTSHFEHAKLRYHKDIFRNLILCFTTFPLQAWN